MKDIDKSPEDISNLYNSALENPSSMITIEHLTNTIQNLNEKLVLLEAKATEFDQQRTKLADSEKIRIDLSQCLKESSTKILQHNQTEANMKNELIGKQKVISKENQELRKQLNEITDERNSFALQLKELNTHASVIESDIKILKAKMRDQVVLDNNVKVLKEAISESETKHQAVFI